MKISFVLGHELPFPPQRGGGVNSLLSGLCLAIARLGHEVTAYSPETSGRPCIEHLDGIRHVRIKSSVRRRSNIVNFVAGVPYALRVYKALEPCDVLSCHLWHGFLFSRYPHAQVVTHTIHRDPKKFLQLFTLFDRIYAGSEAVTREACKVAPLIAPKCRTISNAVDYSSYSEAHSPPHDGFVRFIYVGRFSADKGLESFVHAFCDAALLNSSIKFKSIGPMSAQGGGDEALVARMRELVLQRGLTDRIVFSEPIYDRCALDDEIRAADVVVLPSIGGETLNMSILESMRIGRAVLISDLPANAPLLVPGLTGLLARVGDTAHWTDRILELAADPIMLQDFGFEAYRYGRQNFSCEQIASEYLGDFKLIMAKKSV
jgi:glycosyltransferase involved in cell wall biosynthesis